MTTTGAATAQIVRRMSPGTMNRTKPDADAMPATMPSQEQREQHRRDRAEQLPDGGVEPAVLHVLDGRTTTPVYQARDDREHEAATQRAGGVAAEQRRRQHDRQEHDERRREQRPHVLP